MNFRGGMCRESGRPCAKRALGFCPVEFTREVAKENGGHVEEFVPLETIEFALGAIRFCALTGCVHFLKINATTSYADVRELAKVLEDLAVRMENCNNKEGNNDKDRTD
jgi:hypothetical protein